MKQFGATGKFPSGRLGPTDEGELTFGVAVDRGKGVVIIDFGTPVVWLGVPPEQAIAIGETLIRRAKEIEQQ